MTSTGGATRFAGIGVVLGALALLLAITTIIQGMSNRALQQQVTEGQAQVARAQTLANLDKSLIELIAKSSVENKDDALRDLLARGGVTFTTSAPAVATSSGDTPNKGDGGDGQ